MIIVVCPSCQARYKFDEARLGNRARAKTRCAKCGGTIEVENPQAAAPAPPAPEPAPPPPATAAAAPTADVPTQPQALVRTAVMQRSDSSGVGGSDTVAGQDLHAAGALALPRDKRFSLAVIQGAATGRIFQITRSRTTVGRSGNDIDLDDPEASRSHAAVEVLADQAILRDLGSTNGTWIDGERIEQHVLANQSEFRIGSHALMFIITDLE
jgi:predicted Zn finger-like uncharacterized protein